MNRFVVDVKSQLKRSLMGWRQKVHPLAASEPVRLVGCASCICAQQYQHKLGTLARVTKTSRHLNLDSSSYDSIIITIKISSPSPLIIIIIIMIMVFHHPNEHQVDSHPHHHHRSWLRIIVWANYAKHKLCAGWWKMFDHGSLFWCLSWTSTSTKLMERKRELSTKWLKSIGSCQLRLACVIGARSITCASAILAPTSS